ncbi:MAG: sigma-70 family RNA polymerase sigma factor [Planctomycetota bacterium]|nr:sigma-70 family RNA polymerase sigma factor [Planctomycetota bacterium]
MSAIGTATWIDERLHRWRAARDAAALGELLKWQRDRAYAIALRILSAEADAEDAVQQAFLKLLSRTQGFEDARAFQAAVYRAVVQCALDLARARRNRAQREADMRSERTVSHATPAGLAEQGEVLRLVRDAVAELDLQDRAVVTLCCQEGLDVAAAAEALDAPRETVRDRLSRALHALRERLRQRGLPLSLILLACMLRQAGAETAPASLCAALDASLAGTPSGAVPAAGLTGADPAEALVHAGLSSGFPTALAAAALLAILSLVGVGAWLASGSNRSAPAPLTAAGEPIGRLVETAPGAEAPRLEPPAPAPGEAAPAQAAAPRADEGLPAGLREAAERALQGFVLTGYEREVEDGKVVYELKGRVGLKRYEIELTPDAQIVKIEEDDEDVDVRPRTPPPPPASSDEF